MTASASGSLFCIFSACVVSTHAHLRVELAGMELAKESTKSNIDTQKTVQDTIPEACAGVSSRKTAPAGAYNEFKIGDHIITTKEDRLGRIDDLAEVYNTDSHTTGIQDMHSRSVINDPLCDPKTRVEVLSLPQKVKSNILVVSPRP